MFPEIIRGLLRFQSLPLRLKTLSQEEGKTRTTMTIIHLLDSSGVYIPPSASIIDTDFPYVEREADDFKSYINNVPFEMVKFLPTGVRGTSEAESASFIGTNLGDLGLKGSEIEITGLAETMDDLYKIKAAMAQDGRSFLELGGSRKGYFISGLMSVHASSEDMAAGDIPGENLTFSATIKTEFPYQETMIKKVRDHYVYGSCIVSSDDIHSGNIVKNNNLSGCGYSTYKFRMGRCYLVPLGRLH